MTVSYKPQRGRRPAARQASPPTLRRERSPAHALHEQDPEHRCDLDSSDRSSPTNLAGTAGCQIAPVPGNSARPAAYNLVRSDTARLSGVRSQTRSSPLARQPGVAKHRANPLATGVTCKAIAGRVAGQSTYSSSRSFTCGPATGSGETRTSDVIRIARRCASPRETHQARTTRTGKPGLVVRTSARPSHTRMPAGRNEPTVSPVLSVMTSSRVRPSVPSTCLSPYGLSSSTRSPLGMKLARS